MNTIERNEIFDLRRRHERQRRTGTKQSDRIRGRGRTKGGKAGREATQIDTRLKAAERRLRRLETELLAAAEIVVSGTLHAGVKVKFGRFEHVFLDPQKAVRLSYDAAKNALRIEALIGEALN